MMQKSKRFGAILLALVMLTAFVPSVTPDATAATSGDWEYEVTDGKATIIGYTGKGGDVTIPSKLDGYTVQAIGWEAFKDNTNLTGITIPDSVIYIGSSAFEGTGWYNRQPDGILYLDSWCLGYKGEQPAGELTFKTGTKGLAEYAFYGCTELTTVTIPDNVTSISYAAFEECTGLTSVTIPDSVTSIAGYAFLRCSGLTNITIPDSVTTIAHGVFAGCTGLTNVIIPDSVTVLGMEAFDGCTSLTSLTIGNSVKVIGWAAFMGCTGLTDITIPDSVTDIVSSAFTNTGWYNQQPDGILYLDNWCLGYKGDKPGGELSLKQGTKGIIDEAFLYCTGLKSVTIPNSVTSIGYSAFEGCNSLKSVTIPNSVTSIGDSAFSGCTSLTISCYSGSYAHTYAKENNIPVKLLAQTYTVKFNKNGGSGTMKNQTITTGKSTKLTANSFTRKGYVFAGWNTKKNGSGTEYTDKKSVKNLAASGKSITLYAQWTKVSAPTKAVTNLKLTSPKTKQLKVTYKAVSGAAGYRIEYSTSKSFTKATTKSVHTTKLTYTLKSLSAKKTYYVRVTAYKEDSTKAKFYSKKTATKNLKTK